MGDKKENDFSYGYQPPVTSVNEKRMSKYGNFNINNNNSFVASKASNNS